MRTLDDIKQDLFQHFTAIIATECPNVPGWQRSRLTHFLVKEVMDNLDLELEYAWRYDDLNS